MWHSWIDTGDKAVVARLLIWFNSHHIIVTNGFFSVKLDCKLWKWRKFNMSSCVRLSDFFFSARFVLHEILLLNITKAQKRTVGASLTMVNIWWSFCLIFQTTDTMDCVGNLKFWCMQIMQTSFNQLKFLAKKRLNIPGSNGIWDTASSTIHWFCLSAYGCPAGISHYKCHTQKLGLTFY